MNFFTNISAVTLIGFLLFSCDNSDVTPHWEKDGKPAGSESRAPIVSGAVQIGDIQNTHTEPTSAAPNKKHSPPSTLAAGKNDKYNSASAGEIPIKMTGYFENGLLDISGNQISISQLAGKTVGIYFAANWHPASHEITPDLIKLRNRNQSEFEVVFISLCNSEAEKSRFMQQTQMSCPTIPGARSKEAASLARQFNIQAMPQLIIISKDGNVITTNGLKDIQNGGALAKWKRG